MFTPKNRFININGATERVVGHWNRLPRKRRIKKKATVTTLLTHAYVPFLSAEQHNEMRVLMMNQALKVLICRVILM